MAPTYVVLRNHADMIASRAMHVMPIDRVGGPARHARLLIYP
jgi:hypothetical protein